MRHAILGAGGVGGLLGACLARVGEDVTMVVRQETLTSQPGKLHLDSTFGSWDADVQWAASVPSADIVWIAVKATHLDSALRSIPDGVALDAVIPLLNGIDHLDLLRSRFGAERVIPGTIAGETERVSVGHIVQKTPFEVLNLSSRARARFETVAERLRGIGLTCNFVDDEITLMWSKLVFLAPLALTTTAFNMPVGEVMTGLETWKQFGACVREACAAGQAEGAKVDAEVILKQARKLPGAMRSSMQKDVDNQRPPELDAIGGPLVRSAKRHGLSAAVTSDLMTQIERRMAKT